MNHSNEARSLTTRFLDENNNRNFLRIEEHSNARQELERIDFVAIYPNGNSYRYSYSFSTLSFTLSLGDTILENIIFSSKVDMKNAILQRINKNDKLRLVCHKENCHEKNCVPKLSVGNKMFSHLMDKAKSPYFSSSCNTIEYNESPAHLNTKIAIFEELHAINNTRKNLGKKQPFMNIEIEKTFGTNRRADVYYEKEYFSQSKQKTVKEKYAVEVQRSNITYEDILERTQWYTEQEIAVLWVVVDDLFNLNNLEKIQNGDLKIPLLTLIGYCMKNNHNRFFVFDMQEKKLLSLTLSQEGIENFNILDDKERRDFKKSLTTDNLYLLNNKPEEKSEFVSKLPYKLYRDKKYIYTSLAKIGQSNLGIVELYWNKLQKRLMLKKIKNYSHSMKTENKPKLGYNFNYISR